MWELVLGYTVRMWVRGAVLALLAGGCDLVFGLSNLPVPADAGPLPPTRWTAVAAGELHTCGIRVDQTLWCWGRNDLGELGLGTDELELDVPAQVGADTWASVSAAGEHTCGVKTDGTGWCWGENATGQLGDGQDPDLRSPGMVMGAWKVISTGLHHTCGIHADGGLACWGNDEQGELGDGTPTETPLRTPIWPSMISSDAPTSM